jgi:hypothetical protein
MKRELTWRDGMVATAIAFGIVTALVLGLKYLGPSLLPYLTN